MNANELREWIQRTADRFPGVSQFFERATDRKSVSDSWAAALSEVSRESANEFTEAMVAGTVEPATYIGDWAKLPAMLRRWAKENRPLVARTQATWTDERAFKCLLCWDRGYGVEVFNPLWVRHESTSIELRELAGNWWTEARTWCEEQGAGPLRYACDCCCDEGQRVQRQRKEQRQAYMPKSHCIVPPGGPRQWLDSLASWVIANPILDQYTWQPALGVSE